MFLARDKKGHLINALENEVKKQAYYCPACGTSVRLKKGKNIRTHFAHKSLKDCDFSFENEGPEHLTNKESLYHWLKKDSEAQLEYPIPEIKQIADVFVNGKIALEIQCSSLPQKVLRDRSSGYRSQGYQVIWLLGERLWIKKRLTRLQKDFLYFSQNMGFYVWELDQKRNCLRLKYLIHQDLRGHVHCLIKEFSFGDGNLLEILRYPYQRQHLSSFSVKIDKNICQYIRQQLYYQNPFWMTRQEEAYRKGENLLNYGVAHWFPQVRPIEHGLFCQITVDLQDYYYNFQAYYQLNPKIDTQKLYPPAFYQQYFLKNMVK